MTTELNVLQELVRPNTRIGNIKEALTGKNKSVSSVLPSGQLGIVPWRRVGVKHTYNEAYFDLVEQFNAVVDKSGALYSADIVGKVGIAF